MKIDVKNCFYFFSFYNHICTEEKEMFNDIFYFVNGSERNYLKEELQDLAGKKIIICKRMKKDSSSYEELIEIKDENEKDIRFIKKIDNLFNKLVLDRPYEVLVDRL